jgi:hypothetical protein
MPPPGAGSEIRGYGTTMSLFISTAGISPTEKQVGLVVLDA